MNYNDFIREFNEYLNTQGVRITISKTKELFELFGDFVKEELKEDDKISIREFFSIEKVLIPPIKLPNGNYSEEQYSIKIKISKKYKEEFKEYINKK